MTLNFQNKIIFPAPENSYTSETAYGQVIYIPRDIMKRAKDRAKHGYPAWKRDEQSKKSEEMRASKDSEINIQSGVSQTLQEDEQAQTPIDVYKTKKLNLAENQVDKKTMDLEEEVKKEEDVNSGEEGQGSHNTPGKKLEINNTALATRRSDQSDSLKNSG